MAFHVRDPETDRMVRELAQRRGLGITEAIKEAVGAELQRTEVKPDLMETVREIQDRVAALGRSGLKADKAFFDDLSGEGDD